MDASRFDSWTRTRATTTNRRALLGGSLAAGLAAAFSRFQPALAQTGGSCTYEITLTSSLDAGSTVSGALVIDIDAGGAIDTGSLTLAGQAAASIVGQATGPAIDLLAALDDGSMLSLTGVSDAEISGCSSFILGSLANADSEQLGTWMATPDNTSSSSVPVQPPLAEPTSTPTPAAAPAASACDPPKMICGQNCCPAGADCLDAGACQCPTGTEECGIACFPSCADGVTALDPATCLCPTG
ncbi:MAG TPA: hypothetical protein VFP05_19555 [Thermomicrobiales bacterium]|nr:hypothetical protein [Thermomicrobiales bacterium]